MKLNGKVAWSVSATAVIALLAYSGGYLSSRDTQSTVRGVQMEKVRQLETDLHEVQELVQTIRAESGAHDTAMDMILRDVETIKTDLKEVLKLVIESRSMAHTHSVP